MATKKIAAVVTEYRRWSHADVILGKILEGYLHDSKERPDLELASMYVDQFPDNDMSRELAKKYKFVIYDSIPKALTRGGALLAVDGVLIIGEHGKYADNDKGQKLYPRRRFFEAVMDTFARYKKSVPVFTDKHLSYSWENAKWMYDRARELFVPLLAGSSLPVTWRKPPVKLPMGCALEEVVQVGYGPFEGYGFHALEAMQCMVERRKGGETGVKSVQCLQGEAMWKAMDEGRWSKSLLEAALERVPAHAKGNYRELTAKSKSGGVFLIDYKDGLKAAVAMMNGYVYEGDGGAFTFAAKQRDKPEPVSTHFYLQQPDPFGHFAYLLRAIDSMMQTGHPPYPVERTLLTTGILDAVMTSRHEMNKKLDTPQLAIKYQPTDWPFATDPVPKTIKR
ncbi:MAG: hypothetical protein AB7K24_02695 [Gemmataceae bacterium]